MKKIARDLLTKLKGEKFVLDWRLRRDRQSRCARDHPPSVRCSSPPVMQLDNVGGEGRENISVCIPSALGRRSLGLLPVSEARPS